MFYDPCDDKNSFFFLKNFSEFLRFPLLSFWNERKMPKIFLSHEDERSCIQNLIWKLFFSDFQISDVLVNVLQKVKNFFFKEINRLFFSTKNFPSVEKFSSSSRTGKKKRLTQIERSYKFFLQDGRFLWILIGLKKILHLIFPNLFLKIFPQKGFIAKRHFKKTKMAIDPRPPTNSGVFSDQYKFTI